MVDFFIIISFYLEDLVHLAWYKTDTLDNLLHVLPKKVIKLAGIWRDVKHLVHFEHQSKKKDEGFLHNYHDCNVDTKTQRNWRVRVG